VVKNNKGIKKQVLGGVLLFLGVTVSVLDITLGTGIDIFYIVLTAIGISLLIFGTVQNKSS